MLFTAAALGLFLGAVSWLLAARRAWRRARLLEHRHLYSGRWRSLGLQDLLTALLFISIGVACGAEALEGLAAWPDWFLLLALVPLSLSMRNARRFQRMLREVEDESDFAQRQRERMLQEEALADRLGERLDTPALAARDGVVVRTVYHPAEGVMGGDFVWTSARRGQVLFFVGDVTGHGLGAAIEALRLKDLLAACLLAGNDLATALNMANILLAATEHGEFFATAFVGCYQQGTLHYANAGHPPALLVSADGVRELGPTGPLLGATGDAHFTACSVGVEAGTRLVAYTDGLLEAFGRDGGLDPTQIAALVRGGGFTDLPSAVSQTRNEPLRDDIAAVELVRR